MSWKILATLCCLASPSVAEQSGLFTYTDQGTTVTITDYPTNATGAVVIPPTILDPVSGLQDKVTAIGFEAFRDCTLITHVTVPSEMKTIGNSAFYNCAGLTSVTIQPGVSNLTIGTFAFYNCQLITSMHLPSGVTNIGANAFYLCRGITAVTLPTSLTSIGGGAFYNCSALTSVVIPSSVNTVAGAAFYSCSGLTSVTIPNSVLSLGTEAFRYCSALTTLVLPPNLQSIGNRAFANCRGLTQMVIPATVTTIGTDVFSICSSLTSITVTESNPYFTSSADGVLFNDGMTTLIAFPAGKGGGYRAPASVTSIGSKAFFSCKKLVGVTLPPDLISLGSQAFAECDSLLYANFTGNAMDIFSNVFELAASGFAVYFLNTSLDFTTPTWSFFEYPAFDMGTNETPATDWLLSKGLPANSVMLSDNNGDGVSLLMAYGLNLDPHANLTHQMPQPVVAPNQMSLTYYAGNSAVTYEVKTCNDLQNWSTDGVVVSAPDANQFRTATVPVTAGSRFMRLEVSH